MSGTAFAVLLFDLDHFKEINDKHGHEVGDQVLKAVANRMLQVTRFCDTVARYGGDEFVILITDLISPESAELDAERVLQAIHTDRGDKRRKAITVVQSRSLSVP